MSKQKVTYYGICVLLILAVPAFAQIRQDFKPVLPNSISQKFYSGSQTYDKSAMYGSAEDFDPILAAQFQHVLDSLVITNKIMGASAAIIFPGKGTWQGVYGMSNPGTKKEINPDMLFDIGSNTKTFIATLVLRLEEEGLLNIEDPLFTWLPTFSNIDSTITLHQLLNHTGGVSDFSNENPAWGESVTSDPNRYWTPEQSLSLVLEPNFAPGTGWSYSNTGYVLAGMTIKTVTDTQLVSPSLHKYILDPLNLTSTYLDIEDSLAGEMADGWVYSSETRELYNYSQVPRTAVYSSLWTCGAMVSTAKDLARFAQALYGGEILSQTSLDKMLTVFPFDNPELLGYGLGTMHKMWYNEELWMHGGDTIHFGAQAAYWPKHNISIAVLINQRNYPYEDLYNPVAAALFQSVLQYFESPHDKVYPQRLIAFPAYYSPGTGPIRISVRLNNPENHEAQVFAKIRNLSSTFTDSTALNCFSTNGEYLEYSGSFNPVSLEDEFIVGITSVDMVTEYRHSRENIGRFTSIGPLTVEKFEFLGQDTEANPGDLMLLKVTLRNQGSSATAQKVTAGLISYDPLVSVPDYFRNFGDVKAGDAQAAPGVFSIRISTDCPDSTILPVGINIRSNDRYYWSDTIFVSVKKPVSLVKNMAENQHSYQLMQNYPNPFNATTKFTYSLPSASHVELAVFSITGQKIDTLTQGYQTQGSHTIEWNAAGYASGVYIYRLVADFFVQTKKLVIVN
ncbi:serine hydrolase [candidate division KSB1 bacterium]|nr:serine hydrolase [candidate division KSB1 bacterium]